MIRLAKKSGKSAMCLLLSKIESSELKQSLWLDLIEAVRIDHPHMIHAVEGLTTSDQDSLPDLLKLFSPAVINKLNCYQLCPLLLSYNIITESDRQEIGHVDKYQGNLPASFALLDLIHRRSSRWYSDFVQLLLENDLVDILQELVPALLMKKNEKPKSSAGLIPPLPAKRASKRNIESPIVCNSSDYITALGGTETTDAEVGPDNEETTYRIKQGYDNGNLGSGTPNFVLEEDEDEETLTLLRKKEELKKRLTSIERKEKLQEEVQRLEEQYAVYEKKDHLTKQKEKRAPVPARRKSTGTSSAETVQSMPEIRTDQSVEEERQLKKERNYKIRAYISAEVARACQSIESRYMTVAEKLSVSTQDLRQVEPRAHSNRWSTRKSQTSDYEKHLNTQTEKRNPVPTRRKSTSGQNSESIQSLPEIPTDQAKENDKTPLSTELDFEPTTSVRKYISAELVRACQSIEARYLSVAEKLTNSSQDLRKMDPPSHSNRWTTRKSQTSDYESDKGFVV